MMPTKVSSLTFELADSLLSYDPATGHFTWKVDRGYGVKAGDRACYVARTGYITISIRRVRHLAHRVAWLLSHKSHPDRNLDHINGIKTDNRLCNLRLADSSVNNQNQRRARKDNISGFLGVSAAREGRWTARLKVGGKTRYFGSFCSPEEAHQAYVDAKRKHHPGCTL